LFFRGRETDENKSRDEVEDGVKVREIEGTRRTSSRSRRWSPNLWTKKFTSQRKTIANDKRKNMDPLKKRKNEYFFFCIRMRRRNFEVCSKESV
jgi:hypothetical protein